MGHGLQPGHATTGALLLSVGALWVACATPTPMKSSDAGPRTGAVLDAAGATLAAPASLPQSMPSSVPTEGATTASSLWTPLARGRLDCVVVRGLVQKRTPARVGPETPTLKVIQAAYDRGDITYEQKLLFTVFAESDPGRLPRKYRGCDKEQLGFCGNASVWASIDPNWDCLSPKVRDELECYRPKPTRCVHPDGIRRNLSRPRANPCPAPKASAQSGYLRLVSRPPARIYVDGADVGLTTPVERLSLAEGEHTIELKHAPLKLSRTFTVRIKPNKTVAFSIRLR
jgi:hypothetical protein